MVFRQSFEGPPSHVELDQSANRAIVVSAMNADVARILAQMIQRDSTAAGQLLPLVYDELRKLAAAKLVHEKPD